MVNIQMLLLATVFYIETCIQRWCVGFSVLLAKGVAKTPIACVLYQNICQPQSIQTSGKVKFE